MAEFTFMSKLKGHCKQRNPEQSRDRYKDENRDREKSLKYCPACPFRTNSDQKFKDHWKEKHIGTKKC